MVQTTPNYGLQQPQGNDTVDLVDLITNNTNIVDTQMKANATAAAAAQTSANNAQTTASAAQSTATQALSAAQNISTATTASPGTVEVSAPPASGQNPVAVSTTDPVYENAARKDTAQIFTAKQTFNAGVVMQASDVENALGFTPLSTTGQAADSAKLGGVAASQYAQLAGSAPFSTVQTALAWAASGLTGATAGGRFVGATTGGAPTSGTWEPADFATDQNGNSYVYAQAKSSSGSVNPLTSANTTTNFTTGDSYFTSIQVSEAITISAVSIDLGSSGGSAEAAIFNSSGTLLSGAWSSGVTMSSGVTSIPLNTPVTLQPGTNYYVGIYVNDSNSVYLAHENTVLATALGGTITLGSATYYGSGTTFTTSTVWESGWVLSLGFTYTVNVASQWVQQNSSVAHVSYSQSATISGSIGASTQLVISGLPSGATSYALMLSDANGSTMEGHLIGTGSNFVYSPGDYQNGNDDTSSNQYVMPTAVSFNGGTLIITLTNNQTNSYSGPWYVEGIVA